MAAPDPPSADWPPLRSLPMLWPAPTPAAPRRAPAFTRVDLIGSLRVLAVVALLGLPLGWVWSRLAPGQLSVVQPDGSLVALPPESQHRFDGLALFVLLGLAAGVLAAVGVWLLRERRGPLALLGLALGSLIAGWLAMRVGVGFAEARYDDAVRAAGVDAVVAAAPRLESPLAVVAQPLGAALSYGVAAAINGLDDLGRRLGG
jgi:Protein of unknown function (DUF2567)